MTLSDNGELQVLDEIFNAGVGTFPAGDPYIQLHSADPGEAGTTNIVAIARVQAAFGAAAAGTLSNSAAISFASMPATDVAGWSVWDVADPTPADGSPLGACFMTGWFSTVSGLALVRTADATNNDVQSVAHGLAANDRVVFEAVEGLTVPAGLTAGTLYHVIATGLTTDAFRVSTTQGGAAVDITGTGSAVWRKVTVTTVSAGNTFQINAGDLDIFAE